MPQFDSTVLHAQVGLHKPGLQGYLHVLSLHSRKYVVYTHTTSKPFQYVLNGIAQISDARFSMADIRIDCNVLIDIQLVHRLGCGLG